MGVENHKAASVTLLHPKSVEAKKEVGRPLSRAGLENLHVHGFSLDELL